MIQNHIKYKMILRKYFSLLTFLILVNISSVVFADNAFTDKIWNIDDFPIGKIQSYNGLEIIQASNENDKPVIVEYSSKKYENLKFEKRIKTQGKAAVSNYVPSSRAIKINTSGKCILTFYCIGNSTTVQDQKVRITTSSKLLEEFNVYNDKIKKCQVYIDKAGTYYIYGLNSSISVYYIKLSPFIYGDANIDGKVSDEDLVIMERFLQGYEELSNCQIKIFDYDLSGKIDKNDKSALRDDIMSVNDNICGVTSEKVWSFDGLKTGIVNENIYFDGIEILPRGNNFSINEVEIKDCNKNYENIHFSKLIDTYGSPNLNYCIPDGRALKINTDQACLLKVYARSSSSETNNKSGIVITRKGDIIKKQQFESLNEDPLAEIKECGAYLPEPDTYYIFSLDGGMDFYRISLERKSIYAESYKTMLDVQNNKEYQFYITGDKFKHLNKDTVYKISYNTNVLDVRAIDDFLGEDVNVLEYSDDRGYIKFKVNKEKDNWSGIITQIKFVGTQNGSSTIKIEIE